MEVDDDCKFDMLDAYTKLQLFNFLDKEALCNCLQVCKEWKEIIETNTSMMSKFKIYINSDSICDSDELQQCKRKFIKMGIKGSSFSSPEVMKSIENIKFIAEHVTVLDIQKSDISNYGFSKLIVNFSCLKKLLISSVTLKPEMEHSSIETPKICLETLVLLELDTNGDNLRTLIDMNLQSKKIFINSGPLSSQQDRNYLSLIGSFLGRQENLRSLGIKTNSERQRNTLFENLVVSMKDVTSIEHLSLLLFDESDESFNVHTDRVRMESINTFIQMNKNSLKSLELNHFFIPREVYKTLISDLKLEKLILDVFNYPSSIGLYSPNNHLKTLIVKQPLHDDGLLFKAFPSIEYLSLEDSERAINENLLKIANSLKVIKYLKLPLIPDDAPLVQIPSLRAFSTGVYGNSPQSLQSTINFLNSNRSIELLALKSSNSLVNLEKINDITRNLTNLKRLFISQTILSVDENMLRLLSENCKNLEIFQLQMQEDNNYDEIKRNYDLTHYEKLFFSYVDYDVENEIFNRENSIWFDEKDFLFTMDSIMLVKHHSHGRMYDDLFDDAGEMEDSWDDEDDDDDFFWDPDEDDNYEDDFGGDFIIG